MDQAQLGYRGKTGDGSDDNIQLDKVNVTLLPGSRIGLLGPNGAGKSTLIKSLTGELELLNGKRVPGEHLAIGYFAQHQLEGLDVSSTPFVHVQRLSPLPAIRRFATSWAALVLRVTTPSAKSPTTLVVKKPAWH
ncbi:hypothetical protein HSBAA_64460 [Vreelandella sulfidaeris]|uniref:ABC transporter domain-containing protein n=1 Tax=Vreelandella sulfidaeris TaxID=115553 RepID=A0A455UFY8_9GAMM|nr:hypothetical protein HSBAA_64460 [Halomonas sulfidaeris]